MQTINVEILNPKAKKLLKDLADLNLISIKPDSGIRTLLTKLRKNETEVPSLEEITKKVEEVRRARYEQKP